MFSSCSLRWIHELCYSGLCVWLFISSTQLYQCLNLDQSDAWGQAITPVGLTFFKTSSPTDKDEILWSLITPHHIEFTKIRQIQTNRAEMMSMWYHCYVKVIHQAYLLRNNIILNALGYLTCIQLLFLPMDPIHIFPLGDKSTTTREFHFKIADTSIHRIEWLSLYKSK